MVKTSFSILMPVTKKSSLQRIDIMFETLSVPPPYSYAYTFRLRFRTDSVEVEYELHYTDRDELSEEEIWEEGFTLSDDYRWEGELPAVWRETLLDRWGASDWKILELADSSAENALVFTAVGEEESSQQVVPQDQAGWEYILQELTQAVYEAGQRESPLCIRYLERQGAKDRLFLSIIASFYHRSLEVEARKEESRWQNTLPWAALEPLMANLYQLDYHSERASQQSPRKPGKYLDPGDGQWYALGKQATNPGKQDYVGELERLISKQWLAR